MTDLEKQQLWEKLGFKPHPPWWEYPDLGFAELPDPTLDNLFKWGVPVYIEKCRKKTESHLPEHYYHSPVPLFVTWIEDYFEAYPSKDPAEALAQAIMEALK